MIANCLMWVMATARCKKIGSKQNHMYMCIEMMMPMQAEKKDRDQFERLTQTCWISEIAYACTKYPIITTVNLFLFLWQEKKNEKKKPTDRWFGNTATPYESPFNVGFFCSNFHIFCYKNIREFAVKIEKNETCICFESIGGCARKCMEINRKMKNKIIENWLCRQANFQRWWIPAKMVLRQQFFFSCRQQTHQRRMDRYATRIELTQILHKFMYFLICKQMRWKSNYFIKLVFIMPIYLFL